MPDYNTANLQQSLEVVPEGTIATVRLTIRPGNAGDGGWLRRSKDGQSEALDCEFVILDGVFAKRKFWTLLTVAGTAEGHAKAGEITASRLRAMLESARGIRPDDRNEPAVQARRISSYGDLDGLSFIARIGVEPPHDGFKAKNRLDRVITPDETAWHPIAQELKPPIKMATPTADAGAKFARPSWAS